MFKCGILVGLALASTLLSGCASHQTTENTDNLSVIEQSREVEETHGEPPASGQKVWKYKTIDAEFKGVRNDKVMVYDKEDKIVFAVLPREITLMQRTQFRNMREGTMVHIEIHSLVDESTGEVVKRELSRIWI